MKGAIPFDVPWSSVLCGRYRAAVMFFESHIEILSMTYILLSALVVKDVYVVPHRERIYQMIPILIGPTS